jgi:hypothetical protein
LINKSNDTISEINKINKDSYQETNMPYTMKTSVTKQNGVQWWNEVNPAAAQRYADFTSSFPGVVSAVGGVSQSNPNLFESTIVFADQAAHQAFWAACTQNADWNSRKSYLTANGFVTQFQFT